jgi:outer membrane protein OmpA-like peptidoglycan-associated protein
MKTQPTSITTTTAGTAHRLVTVSLCSLALLLGACADMGARERGTAQGAAIGSVGGAVLGAATGGKAGKGAVIGGALGAIAGNLWSKRMEDKQRAMEQATRGTGIDVARTADNQLKVNVPSDFSFDSGQSRVKPEMRPVLQKFAQGLDASQRVRIVGHTDSSGSDAVNNPLSLDRAEAVRDYLVGQGVPATRVQVEGRGEREPVADNASLEGRARNRRVEIFLSEPQT